MNWTKPELAEEAIGAGRVREVTIAAIQAKTKRKKASRAIRRFANFREELCSSLSVTTWDHIEIPTLSD